MKKRILSLVLSLIFIFAVFPMPFESKAEIKIDYSFGDRILYGGLAVDIGDDTVVSEDGALYFRRSDGSEEKIADIDAKYLNFYKDALYFINENKIMSCLLDGSGIKVLRDFGSENISCLYVTDGEMFYLKGETVYLFDGKRDIELITRNGIKGFVPEPDGTVRWVKDNPNRQGINETGDNDPIYLEYKALPETDVSSDVVYVPEYLATASNYTGPTVQVGNVTLPMEEHMPGTYFSKNGKACTCHNTSDKYCINSVGNCNCMRYYPTGKAETCEVDLLGAQCFAFSRLVFYKCFGFLDHSMNSGRYYSVGSIASGAVTANTAKSLLMKAKAGAHVRLSRGHSVSILAMDDNYLTVYHANSGGDNVTTSPCVISTKRYTWEYFATYAASGIQYVNMPYNYPDSEAIVKPTGYYKLTSNLNLRASNSTSASKLCVVPISSVVYVTEVKDNWGKITYDGQTGWISLDYATVQSPEKLTPTGNRIKRDESGYLRASKELTVQTLKQNLGNQSITVVDYKGASLSDTDNVGTGAVVSLLYNGKVIDQATFLLGGDVDKNGLQQTKDYMLVCRYVKKTYKLDRIQLIVSEITGDSLVTASDYMLIKRNYMQPEADLLDKFM